MVGIALDEALNCALGESLVDRVVPWLLKPAKTFAERVNFISTIAGKVGALTSVALAILDTHRHIRHHFIAERAHIAQAWAAAVNNLADMMRDFLEKGTAWGTAQWAWATCARRAGT